MRMLYALELASEGYEVVLAGDEMEALQRIEEVRPDLVVLDVCRKTGKRSVEAKEISGKLGSLPVILNTTHEIAQEAWARNIATVCLIKSSDFSALKTKIRELLSQADPRDEKEMYAWSR